MSFPVVPPDFSGMFKPVASYSASIKRPIEPVGQYFLAHATRTLRGHTWSEFEIIEAAKNVTVVNESNSDEEFNEEQSADLLAQDPRDWKACDLYAVLGLSKYRYRATEDQIRRAHRVQVLKHHPDKKSAAGGLDQDDFFKVIQKAFETILDPAKRRQFDSVDFNADVQPPSPKSTYDFYEAWGAVFSAEGRFSIKQPVPSLGDASSSKEEVEAFYRFFHNMDSWRTFEFLDEDVPDDTANRDHKRYIEKKNNNARKKRKAEDTKRLADLVKRANAEDPRIKKFKEDEKAEKARKKWEREAGARQAAEEAAAKKAAEEAAKKAAEEASKQSKESGKKAKEAAKNMKKKNKRSVRAAAKDNSYFGDEARATTIDADLETMIEAFDDVALGELAAKLNGSDAVSAKSILEAAARGLTSEGKLSSLKYFAQ